MRELPIGNLVLLQSLGSLNGSGNVVFLGALATGIGGILQAFAL